MSDAEMESGLVMLSGTVLVNQDDQLAGPVFRCRVLHKGSGTATVTHHDGSFVLGVPLSELKVDPVVWIRSPRRSPGYWPNQVKIDPEQVEAGNKGDFQIALGPEDCFLERLPTLPFEANFIWLKSILGWIVDRWFLANATGRILMASVFPIVVLLGAHLALDVGVGIPWTQWDDLYRERVQRWQLPTFSPTVRLNQIRHRYYSGIDYELPRGTYVIGAGGMEIEDNSSLTIEPGTILRMQEDSGILVSGKLIADGDATSKIEFVRNDIGKRWNNITVEGNSSHGSIFRHCVIRGGSGIGTSGSTDGFFSRLERGRRVGGGLLLSNTSVSVEATEISDCAAVFGGGVYIRSHPDVGSGNPVGKRPGGSTFHGVTIRDCVAKGEKISAGGGIFIKGTVYPQFEDGCLIEGNQAIGKYACGGGIYAGRDSRIRVADSTIRDNSSSAEGGGVYVTTLRNSADDHHSGAVIIDCNLSGNRANGAGGALCGFNSRVSLSNVDVTNNRVGELLYQRGNTSAKGGGVFLDYTRSFRSVDENGNPYAATFLTTCNFKHNKVVADAEFPPDVEASHQTNLFAGGGLSIRTAAARPPRFVTNNLNFHANRAPLGKHVAIPSSAVLSNKLPTHEWRFLEPPANDPSATYIQFRDRPTLKPASRKHIRRTLLPDDCYGTMAEREINAVVIHFMSAVNIRPDDPYNLLTLLSILRGEHEPDAPRLSAHYLITREGMIHQLVDDRHRAWHAGHSRMPGPDGANDVNDFSIGIEIVRTEDEPPTEAQYLSLIQLLLLLKQEHPSIEAENIVGHDTIRAEWIRAQERSGVVRENDPVRKNDPGPLFHWSRVINEINRSGF